MKRFSTLFPFVTVLLLGLIAMPALAQDTGDAAAQNPLYYGVVVVLALLLVAALIFGGYITQWLAKLVPPETATSIYQSGVRMGLQLALNQAVLTASPLDEEFFTDLATQRGYSVEKLADGHYEVKIPVPRSATAQLPK